MKVLWWSFRFRSPCLAFSHECSARRMGTPSNDLHQKKEDAFPHLSWDECVAKMLNAKTRDIMEKTWKLAAKVHSGAAKLAGDPGLVRSGERFEHSLVERIPFIRNEDMTAEQKVSLEACYSHGIVNVTVRNHLNRPVKGALVPGYEGPLKISCWVELLRCISRIYVAVL